MKFFKKQSLDKNISTKINNTQEPILTNENTIIITKLDGSIQHSTSLEGLKVYFGGNNNRLYLHEPIPKFINSEIHFMNNSIIKIKSSQYDICNLFIFEVNNSTIEIGENFSCGGCVINCFSNSSKVYIGDDCMFSRDIDILANDCHSIFDIKSKKLLNPIRPIHIGRHVWICQGVKILKGVKVGNNSVVSINTILRREYNLNNILIKDKKITKNINWERTHLDSYGKNND